MNQSKIRFLEKIRSQQTEKSSNSKVLLNRADYDAKVSRILQLNDGEKRTLADSNLTAAFEVATYDDVNVLRKKGTTKRIVCVDEIYDVIKSAHDATGHGGRHVTHKHISPNFHNITVVQIQYFLDLCEECQLKRSRPKKSIVVKPILSTELNSRCQVDLIDMQSQPDGQYRFILNYQDHLTKFVQLRPLKSKTAESVAEALVPIFLIFGAPLILHMDNGREFANKVIKQIASKWTQCKIVHGKPRHSQSQGSVERANRDVEDKLACWLRDNKPRTWSEGLNYVQFQKNSSHHSGISCSPYSAMFGGPPKTGLLDLNIPHERLATVETEEHLEAIFGARRVGEVDPEREDEDEGTEKENQSVQNSCIVCDMDVSFDETCSSCSSSVHYDDRCSTEKSHSADAPSVRHCMICKTKENTASTREAAYSSLKRQATKMLDTTNKRLKTANVFDSVMLPIPDVDRGRGDHKNLKGIIMAEDNGFFTVGTEHGKLGSQYTRNQFTVCAEKLLEVDAVPDKILTLREAARLSSSGTGQGYFFCTCVKACSGRCKCVKAKRTCNSKCHSSNPCKNK